MATPMFSESFKAAFGKSFFNASEWIPKGPAYSLKEIWDGFQPGLYETIDGDTAEVIAQEFESGDIALRIEIPFKDGSSVQLKLSGRSSLKEGDVVKISSITGQELRKLGQDAIVRFDGEKVE